MTKENVIDLQLGAQLIGKDQYAAYELITLLVSQLPNDKKQMVEAFAEKDYQELARLVHRLHGGTCYCGTPRLKYAAATLEGQMRSNDTSKISDAFMHLQGEIDAVLDTFENLSLTTSN